MQIGSKHVETPCLASKIDITHVETPCLASKIDIKTSRDLYKNKQRRHAWRLYK